MCISITHHVDLMSHNAIFSLHHNAESCFSQVEAWTPGRQIYSTVLNQLRQMVYASASGKSYKKKQIICLYDITYFTDIPSINHSQRSLSLFIVCFQCDIRDITGNCPVALLDNIVCIVYQKQQCNDCILYGEQMFTDILPTAITLRVKQIVIGSASPLLSGEC